MFDCKNCYKNHLVQNRKVTLFCCCIYVCASKYRVIRNEMTVGIEHKMHVLIFSTPLKHFSF